MDFDLDYLMAQWPALLEGLVMTLKVSLLAIGLSLVIGVVGGAVRLFRVPLLAQLATLYVEVIRNTPILVQLFFIFYGLPAVGLGLSLFWSGVLCLSLWAGAYQIENLRGGLATVERGMREASLALNLKPWQYFCLIALPIAVRTALPAVLNTAISLLKNSSYLQAIGLAELTFVAVDRIATDFRALEMFSAICVLYLGLVAVLAMATQRLSAHLQRPFRQ
ncbi:putative ABC amino acid transporter permease/substrate-binding protein [Pseudomonas psychrotolerans L19]|uniref:amino acid ABC transporter permease n=1 Tax=Pseudomonas TaxID=286 RepID=UPI00023A17E9|nr:MULTISPECIES: amino acid ABC transporter permease [Pseudomonas]EHK69406.1 putative ABC amino acid transporter permease/substrate-binding protein [Pseudomonas psychrotolerans L19]MBA1181976.1 amino acid ABC transporter permease [Pseudomonas psychrotolerans]MBA1213650.1 amino acid ABC transporter permease [Pseudomonas psychrotolerans]TCQ86545.1 amino acid ABC transporter membrane protein 1 (PAAT family) [Pseudomonas sp. JUb52]